ncbi:MAG: GNAT family protein [Clostridia bacterium]
MDNARYRHVFSNLPTIETERLILKKIVPENANDMYAYASLGEVTKYLLWSSHLNINETKGYIEFVQHEYKKGNYADWGINLKSDDRFIGTIGFAELNLSDNNGEIGYVQNPLYQGNGYMREAANAVLRLGFEQLSLKRIQVRIMDGNILSERMAASCGFKKEGTLRDYMLIKGKYRTIHVYSIIDEEWFLTVSQQ